MRLFGKTLTAAAALVMTTALGHAEDVEVLHWWTSGGEAAALNVLKEDLAGKGIGWQDMPVAGGGGEAAMTALRARVTSGNPPTAVQMLGFDILDWVNQGDVLANLDEAAAAEGWDAVIPAAIQKFSKPDGHWIAAPVNVHSTNWVWANKAVLDELGIAQPTTWDEFMAALREGEGKRASGGTGPWRSALAGSHRSSTAPSSPSGGPEFYQEIAFIDLDPAALNSPEMVAAFDKPGASCAAT
jgi:glucose/mannose transport system substrate-binding protein